MKRSNIDDVVCTFLEYAKREERPYRQLTDLLMLLESQGWTDTEVQEVQSKVFDGISQIRKDVQS